MSAPQGLIIELLTDIKEKLTSIQKSLEEVNLDVKIVRDLTNEDQRAADFRTGDFNQGSR